MRGTRVWLRTLGDSTKKAYETELNNKDAVNPQLSKNKCLLKGVIHV